MHTDGVTVFSQWPLRHFFDYIFSFDSIVSNLQYPRECQGELWIIVRGDGLPCGGESWCQMSISFANHGHLARTLSYHWTLNVALCGEKSTSVLSQVWANNLAFLQSALAPAIRSPYINWMLHDATVTIQAIRPYGLGMFSGDLLEGSKKGAEGHLVLLL